MNYTITKISQTTTVDANGKPAPGLIVEFMVGKHGPFSETFLKAGFTAQVVQQKLNELVAHLQTLAS